METLIKGISLGIILSILALNSGCGQPPITPSPLPAPIITYGTTVIHLFAEPVGDESGGTIYTFTRAMSVPVPSKIYHPQGQVCQNGRGIGIDFGDAGQCYYTASMSTPGSYLFESCTKGLAPGSIVVRNAGSQVIFWAYLHINSNDTLAEWIVEGN